MIRHLKKITTRLQKVGTPTPMVPVSRCPIVLMSHFPSVQESQCPSPLGGTEKHTRGGRETHKEGGDGEMHIFRDGQTDRHTEVHISYINIYSRQLRKKITH